MSYSDKGSIDWEILDYEGCEKKGFFGGLRIGIKTIYLKSPQMGKILFLLFDPEKKGPESDSGISLSPREFDFLLDTVFTERERYYINKCIWRISS